MTNAYDCFSSFHIVGVGEGELSLGLEVQNVRSRLAAVGVGPLCCNWDTLSDS